MKKLLPLIVILVVGYYGYQQSVEPIQKPDRAGSVDAPLLDAFERRASGIQVAGAGHVSRILPDDNDGSRHQRFILELPSGQTVLVAHNIDVAARITGLREKDQVRFYGEYEWNSQGGVIHWTHHDPRGNHEDGWIEHQGTRYE